MNSDSLVPHNLEPALLPRHIAVIMDGNGRWAQKKLMNRVKGHEKGSEAVRNIVSCCRELGIQVLTLYAFSTENWARPAAEVKALMGLLKRFVRSERDELMAKDIRLKVIGQKNRLPDDVQKELDAVIEETAGNASMVLCLALSYGGREDITRAARAIAQKVRDGELALDAIEENTLSNHLYTAGQPDPDMVIRTSGEMRLSNFLLWQAAYAELFVTDTLWPDFGKSELIQILGKYQKRDRRFGKVICSSNDGSPQ